MKTSLITLAFALPLTLAADVTLTGANIINSNTTVGDKVTGSGYYVIANGATLTLSNAENDFTGGVIVSNGVVEATASGAFGTGDIVFDSKNPMRQALLNVDGGTFPNNFINYDFPVAAEYKNAPVPNIKAVQSATVTGKIMSNDNIFDVYSAANKTLTLEGDITAPRFHDTAYGTIAVKGKVISTTEVCHGHSWNENGIMELWNPANEITLLTMKRGCVSCKAADVLYGTIVQWAIESWDIMIYDSSLVRLNGFDQHIACLYREPSYKDLHHQAVGVITGNSQPCTLTTIGTTGYYWASTGANVIGPVKLVMEKQQDKAMAIMRFYHRTVETTGDIDIRSNTFYVQKGAIFPNVSNLTVAAGASTQFLTSTNVFPSLVSFVNHGTMYAEKTCLNPLLCPNATMELDSTSVLKFETGVTNTVKYLKIDGAYQPAGIYTKAELPTIMSASASDAALVVLKEKKGLLMLVR